MVKKSRLVWVDLLRIYATWSVITIHGKSFYDFPVDTNKWKEYVFISAQATFGVPVFIMLSGMLMLNKKHSVFDIVVNKSLRVILMQLLQFLFCGIGGVIWGLYCNGRLSFEDYLYGRNNWGYGNYFFPILFGCYLMVPLLHKILESKKLESYYIICGIIFSLIIPVFTDLDYVVTALPNINKIAKWFDRAEIYLPVGSSLIFVLGHWLNEMKDRISKKTALLLAIAGFISWQALSFYTIRYPEARNIMSILRYGRYYGTYVGPVIIFYSASVFLFFSVAIRDIRLPEPVERIITHMGKNCIIVFLLHGIIINTVGILIPDFWISSFYVETGLNALLYFIIGFLISLIIEKLPLIRGIVR